MGQSKQYNIRPGPRTRRSSGWKAMERLCREQWLLAYAVPLRQKLRPSKAVSSLTRFGVLGTCRPPLLPARYTA